MLPPNLVNNSVRDGCNGSQNLNAKMSFFPSAESNSNQIFFPLFSTNDLFPSSNPSSIGSGSSGGDRLVRGWIGGACGDDGRTRASCCAARAARGGGGSGNGSGSGHRARGGQGSGWAAGEAVGTIEAVGAHCCVADGWRVAVLMEPALASVAADELASVVVAALVWVGPLAIADAAHIGVSAGTAAA